MQADPALKAAVVRHRRPLPAGQRQSAPRPMRRGQQRQAALGQRRPAQQRRAVPSCNAPGRIGGRMLAHLYNRNYLEGAMTKTEIWSPITSYYDILAAPNSGLMYANTPWSGYYDVQSTIWVTAHTTQFAQPGWQYLDASSGYLPEKGTYVTLRSPERQGLEHGRWRRSTPSSRSRSPSPRRRTCLRRRFISGRPMPPGSSSTLPI